MVLIIHHKFLIFQKRKTLPFKINNRELVPSRVFCVGKNYNEHIKELGGSYLPNEPVVFMKPVSSLVAPEETLFYPPYGDNLQHEVEAVILIGKEGRSIPEKNAPSFVAGVSIGLDLTLRDVQLKLKEKGLPWELSKSFEQSSPLGSFKPYNPNSIELEDWPFSCSVDGVVRQQGNTQDMIFPIKKLIHKLSIWWELKPGDIIYTGTPSGVGPLKVGNQVKIESVKIGSFSWNIAPRKNN